MKCDSCGDETVEAYGPAKWCSKCGAFYPPEGTCKEHYREPHRKFWNLPVFDDQAPVRLQVAMGVETFPGDEKPSRSISLSVLGERRWPGRQVLLEVVLKPETVIDLVRALRMDPQVDRDYIIAIGRLNETASKFVKMMSNTGEFEGHLRGIQLAFAKAVEDYVRLDAWRKE